MSGHAGQKRRLLRINDRGALLKVLDKPHLDLTTPLGRSFIAFLSAMAEDERHRGAIRRSGKSVGLGHHGPVRSVLMGNGAGAPRMHSMMHLVWSAIPLFSADGTRAVPIGSLVPLRHSNLDPSLVEDS